MEHELPEHGKAVGIHLLRHIHEDENLIGKHLLIASLGMEPSVAGIPVRAIVADVEEIRIEAAHVIGDIPQRSF